MALTHEELGHLAQLSRLQTTESEMDQMGETLEHILEYIGHLSKVNTTEVSEIETMNHASVLRMDEARPARGEDLERLIRLFPDKLGQYLRVPGVFEKPKG